MSDMRKFATNLNLKNTTALLNQTTYVTNFKSENHTGDDLIKKPEDL